jgi:UPF0755 protein
MVFIKPGMSLQTAAETLKGNGIVSDKNDFIFTAKFLSLEQRIQAGQYALSQDQTNLSLLSAMTGTGQAKTLVTIPEGFTNKQIAGILRMKVGLDSAAFMDACEDTILLKKYEIDAPSFEGFLFPDTYYLYSFIEPAQVIDILVNRFKQVFNIDMQHRAAEWSLTVTETVSLASIIQGEMVQSSEASLIASVYHNRLRRSMRLQADPTIQYIIPNGPRRLFNGDLAIDSPYNTYLYRGLPPGPVCNPGEIALEAALNPSQDSYLYMVSTGDGYHAFNESFRDHLRDKARLDSIRTALTRQRRSQH